MFVFSGGRQKMKKTEMDEINFLRRTYAHSTVGVLDMHQKNSSAIWEEPGQSSGRRWKATKIASLLPEFWKIKWLYFE